MVTGIHSFGAYIPRTRLQRSVIAESNAWFNPALRGLGRGERAVGNWDEDAVTMAVEAARHCLTGFPHERLSSLYLASTSAPFQDRQNAGIVAEALGLGRGLRTLDLGGSQRAGTSALATALAVAGSGAPVLITAAEKRRTPAASPLELTTGDAAAALVVAEGEGAAALIGQAVESVDFVDHYRGQDQAFDHVWEERWIRDEGYLKIVPPVVSAALEAAGVDAAGVAHFCFPGAARGVAARLAKSLGIPESSVRDNLQGRCGEAGTAHPLVMLCHALEEAAPGDVLVVAGFGQGCDALVFRATGAIGDSRPAVGVAGHLARRSEEHNYHRYLGINELVSMDRGLRAEADKQTGLTTLYRNKDTVLGFMGGRCTRCGTLQFPKTRTCAGPNCHAVDTQVRHPFADMPATLNSYTADGLTYSPSPPAYYGMVQFAEGGRAMVDFTDVDPGTELEAGTPMRMVFRIKDIDTRRGFRRYFWKAVPAG